MNYDEVVNRMVKAKESFFTKDEFEDIDNIDVIFENLRKLGILVERPDGKFRIDKNFAEHMMLFKYSVYVVRKNKFAKKAVSIYSCTECPYLTEKFVCSRCNKYVTPELAFPIPYWCPLEDKEEDEQKETVD